MQDKRIAYGIPWIWLEKMQLSHTLRMIVCLLLVGFQTNMPTRAKTVASSKPYDASPSAEIYAKAYLGYSGALPKQMQQLPMHSCILTFCHTAGH